jgi:hypothetical protein
VDDRGINIVDKKIFCKIEVFVDVTILSYYQMNTRDIYIKTRLHKCFSQTFSIIIILFHSLNIFFSSYCSHYDFFKYSTSFFTPKYFNLSFLPYEKDWISNLHKPFNLDYSQSGCLSCSFPVRNTLNNSSPRDLVLSFSSTKIVGIIPFVRTLRSSRSKTQIVLLIDDTSLKCFTDNHYVQLNNCGVSFINFGTLNMGNVDCSRFIPFFHYLYFRRYFFDRVIICDSTDFIFQGDPFISTMHNDTVYFVHENHLSRNNPWMIDWFQNFPDKRYPLPENKSVINSGYISGGVIPVLRALDVFFKIVNSSIELSNPNVLDQVMYNIMVYYGLLAAENIRYALDNDLILGCVTGTVNNFEEDYNQIGYSIVGENSRKYCTFVHQYDRHLNYKESLEKACPQNDLQVSDFFR